MLQPKRTRYSKARKGRIHGTSARCLDVMFGEFGLKALGACRLTSRQIEAARRAITRHIRRQGRVWIRVFPDTPVSKKPIEVRMGKGKGSVEYWVCKVKPGRVLFELEGVSEALAREALGRAEMKLPVNCRFLVRSD